MREHVYLAGGVRTPFGSFGGVFASKKASELGAATIREALSRLGVDSQQVDEVLFGNVVGAGVGQNIARQATLGAGLPTSVGATTINKVCGSAMRSIILSAQAIQCGDAGLVIAGGCESMTNTPYILPKARSGYRMGNGELLDALIHDGLWDVYTNQHMGPCGDLCAAKFDISRTDQDDYAIESYRRAIESWDNGFFADMVVPVEVQSRKGSTLIERDEDLSKYKGEEALRGLRPAFGPKSTITAGNASNISDGAAAIAVFGDDAKTSLNLKPDAKIMGHANVAMDSEWFTIAPIHAIKKLCDKLHWKPAEVDLYEINEAFSIVPIVAIRELGLDHAKVNVAGGAVAIGHPIGASGTRIVNTLIRALQRNGKQRGIASLCIGGGEASAIAVELCD